MRKNVQDATIIFLKKISFAPECIKIVIINLVFLWNRWIRISFFSQQYPQGSYN